MARAPAAELWLTTSDLAWLLRAAGSLIREEAGCDDAEVLRHCRAGAAHVRGCWVLDLLSGNS